MSCEPMSCLAKLGASIERYELKYVIPNSLIEPIADFLEPYCALDEHSRAQASRFYPVNSLYFDSPNFRFLKQRMWGSDSRFNMRVRSYGDGEHGPYFAEIKHKTPTCVRKYRATLETCEWPEFLSPGAGASRQIGAEHHRNRRLFLRLAESYAIEPKIFTCYRRRAYVSQMDDYARVTFDIDMRYRPQDPLQAADPYSLNPDHGCVNYDTRGIYAEEDRYDNDVVLELKATIGAVPIWMIELIRRFELKQVGFSKYLNSSLAEHSDAAWQYMGVDRAACELSA